MQDIEKQVVQSMDEATVQNSKEQNAAVEQEMYVTVCLSYCLELLIFIILLYLIIIYIYKV